MPHMLWTVACGGTLHDRRSYLKRGIPPIRCRRYHRQTTGLSLQQANPTGPRIKHTDNLEIKIFNVIFIASSRFRIGIVITKNKTTVWIYFFFFENIKEEATTTITKEATITIIKRRRRKRKWTTTVTVPASSSPSSSLVIVQRTGKKRGIIAIASIEITSRAGTSSVTSPPPPPCPSSPGRIKGKEEEKEETTGQGEGQEDRSFLLVVFSYSSPSNLLPSLSPVTIFATKGDRVFSEDSPKISPSSSTPVLSSSSFTSSSSHVGWNPRQRHYFHSTPGDDNNNNKIFSLVIKFKLRLLLLSSPVASSSSPRYGPYYYIVIVVYLIAVPALKQKSRERIHTITNNINKNHNVTVILYHNWFLSIGMPRPLDDEFSYEPPGKKNRSSDSTDSTGSSTTSSRKEPLVPKMPKSPRGNQKAASTDVSTIPKSDIRRAQFKGSKSMPAIDSSSPDPIFPSTKEVDEIPVAIEMSSTGRPVETTNLHLKYLLQVTDSELQNMSREVPSSQTMSMGVPSGGKPMTNTQLVLAPVTTSQPSENLIFQEIPVSEQGVEKYHVKSDSLEQQGLKLVYTKPAVDNQEARPMNYVTYKPHSQHQQQSTEKSLQQQQSMTGDSTVGRKRKYPPQKQGRHICQYCGRGCAKPSVLEKHIRAHTNERPFPCANCGLSFKTKSNLSKHTKSRTHALKAGLSQSASSTSSETAGTEGDVDAKDMNESEETQTETSDTDGENDDDSQKLKKDNLLLPESNMRLMRGNSEPDPRLHLEEFKDKCFSPKEGLLLGDRSLSVTTVATAGGSAFSGGSSGTLTRESSDNVQCRMFGEMSKSQCSEIGYLQPSSTPFNSVYLSEKKFYVTKLHESKSASFEGTCDEPSLSSSETTAKSCLIKENPKSKMETLDAKLGTTWSKDNVPLSVSGLSLTNKLPSSALNLSQEQQLVKESEETRPVSSLILSGVPTPSTKEMVEKRISQLISENASIVNTPMKEPPRQKRIFRQFSDPPTSHAPKLDDLPQSSSMSKVSIPSITSIPLPPIPGETDLRKDTSNSPQPFLVSDKYNPQNVVNLTGKSQLSNLAASPSKVDQLGEKVSSGGHSNSNEIKIEIKLSKVATMSNLVATTATVGQAMVGQSNIQYMPAAPAMTSVSKNPENSVIKGLLMKGKTLPASLSSPASMKTIKEKSSSVDDISKFETSIISPLFRGEAGTTSNVEFSIGSKSSQLHKMHHCRSGPAATSSDQQTIFEPDVQYERTDRPKLVKCSSIEKDSFSGSLSHSLSSDRESSNDWDTERGERSKDDKLDHSSSFESYDLSLPKKKGRPKGSKNKPKIPQNSPSLQLQYQPSAPINTPTLSNQQTSILLATLKKKSSLTPQTTLVSTSTTVSSSMIGQPMVSVQNSWTQPSPMIANPVSTPSSTTKLKLQGKILMKRSMSTERMQSQEQESETVSTLPSTGSTPPVKEGSTNLAHLWTSCPDVMKQQTDSNRNERNSPLKKRKVRTSEPSDTVIRPGVTRAGSEPLMSRMGQSWSGSSSGKLTAEKRLSSLPETMEYKPVKTLPNTLPLVVSAPVTVPVAIAEPIMVPMKFFDSIQSSALGRGLAPLPTHHHSLPAIPTSSTLRQGKETPQIPGTSRLVSFLLHKEYKLDSLESQDSQEDAELTSKDVEESLSTNTDTLSSTKIFQAQDDGEILSQSSSAVNLGASTKTTTEINLIQQHLYGHSVNSLRGLPHTTLCCVQQVQPMYVALGDNRNISMYSNWKISQPSQDPGSLSAKMLISLYNSKDIGDPIFAMSSAKSCEVNTVDSCKWSLYSKPKAWLSSSYSIEKLSNGIFNIFTTKSESSKLTLEMKLPSEDRDILHASSGSMESTPSSMGVRDVQSSKQPKRVRIFQGGFRSNEDYIYIRGRGRGKYVCEECGIRCKKPSMLKKHIRTHTDLRPYHCRHCRLSFKTKGNLTKHMKSKAHQKKCLELGIVPVPVTVDESQIDSVALAAQSAIAKDTKILDDENEEDDEDDRDMDDEEETDDADGQFSDSEESARTSFERMDTTETIDTSVDKESECGTPAQASSFDVAEPSRMSEVHSCELSEPEGSTTAEIIKSTSTGSYQVPVSLQTLTTINAPHRQGATSQLQFVNEIAHSLLDLAQRQIPLAEELPPDHLDATDSIILITTSTATNTTITTASTTTNTSTTITSTTTATAVSIQSKAEATEKTLKRQYSFDMDDFPDRGLTRSPTPQVGMPNIQMQFVNEGLQQAKCSVLKQTSSEEIAMINQQAATTFIENSSHKEMRTGEFERISSQLLTHPSMVAYKIDSQEGYQQRQPFITATSAIPNDQPLTHKVYLIPDLPGNLQSTIERESSHGATPTSTLSLSLTGLLPNISQLVKPESSSCPALIDSIISHPQSITPFQFEHPFQAFQRSPNNRNEETRDESQTVIIPCTTSGNEESRFICSPKTVRVSQSLSRESSGMEMMVGSSEATTGYQQGQIVLPSQQDPNNPSVVSIIVSGRNVENIAQQPQLGHKQQSQLVSNSLYTGPTNIPRVVTPTQSFNPNIVVEPQLVENLVPEQSQTRLSEFQPVSLIVEKSTSQNKILLTKQSPTAIVEKTFYSEQCTASFDRQSPKLYIDNSQRTAHGNGQARVHVERRIPMLEVQPMIPNVQLPPQEVGKLSPTQRLGSLSPTRQYMGQLSPKRLYMDRLSPTRQHADRLSPSRQHVDRLSPTRQHVDRLSPTRQHADRLSPTRQHADRLSPTRQHVDRLSPTRQHADRLSPTRQHADRLSPTRQHVDRLSPTRQHVDRLSPTRQHVDRLSPTRQHVDRLSPTRQYVDRLSPSWQHVDRLSPTRQNVDMLLPTRHRVDALSPTRQSIRALSPSRQHIDTMTSSRPHVDTLSSSNQSMDMLSPLRQSLIDKPMGRLSPSKKFTGDRLSPSQQHIDSLSLMRQPSPSGHHMEKLSPTRSFRSQSPTQVTDKLSPTRLTDRPTFRRQANRLSPSRYVEGLSSMHQPDRLSPTRQTERISPGRYENISPTRVQGRISPCRLEQQWPSDQQLPLRIVETQPPVQLADGQLLCMTAETMPTQHKVIEKQLSTEYPESQVSPLVSTSKSKTLKMQQTVEEPLPLKDSHSSQHLTLQKSFKDDLNKCHICNKSFSNAQDYTEHRRQHLKTQTHHSQDSSCGHSRPHLHKCFHSEGHSDSRSMSIEEIPRPPDCKNCKVDFWKQNHLPKHLWVKKHRLTLMWDKNSSSTDSESAAPPETIPDTVVTSASVSGPSRVETIQGTEKALDLSIDESTINTSLSSTCVTATCTHVTSVTTTAAITVTTTAVIPEDMVSHEPALMIADTRGVSREQAAITSADITDHSSFFIRHKPLCKKYIDSSGEEVKDEMVEAEHLRSGIRNPTHYECETSVIPITPMATSASHACHLCPRSFTSTYQLENHLSHADPRPYVCEYCDAGFTKKRALHIHLQMHLKQENPYVCGMCGETFVSSQSLKQHSLSHSNVAVETHRSFDESALYSYQQGTRIGSPLPKVYDRGVHMGTSQLCSQDHFSSSFSPRISTAYNIQQKQPQYRLSSTQAQQYYSTGDSGPVIETSTLAALALDSVVSKP